MPEKHVNIRGPRGVAFATVSYAGRTTEFHHLVYFRGQWADLHFLKWGNLISMAHEIITVSTYIKKSVDGSTIAT